VRYHRPEEIHKGRLIESRVENIIVFLPDIAGACMPTSLEWEETISTYKQKSDEEIAEELNEATIPVHIYSLISFFFFFFFLSCVQDHNFITKYSVFLPFPLFFFFNSFIFSIKYAFFFLSDFRMRILKHVVHLIIQLLILKIFVYVKF
jgi:hypothetical protein